MPNPATILIYGRDASLLETRRMLLETTGGKVYVARECAETEKLIRAAKPDLLVLCFTLTDEERKAILTVARNTDPDMNVLVLVADGSGVSPTAEGVFSVFRGPAALRAKVEGILRSPINA